MTPISTDNSQIPETERMRRAGQFMVDFNIPFRRNGIERAKQIAQSLQNEFTNKILDPATKAGILLDVGPALARLSSLKAEFDDALPPFHTGSNAVDKLLRETEQYFRAIATANKPFAYLTPSEVQDLIRDHQDLLKDYSELQRSGGHLTVYDEVMNTARAELIAQLRKVIEELDPQVHRINWTIDAALDVADALQRYHLAGSRTIKLFDFRQLSIAWNKFLNRIAGTLSTSQSEFRKPEN